MIDRIQHLAMRAGLVARQALRSVNERLSFAMHVASDSQIIDHHGPWCVTRESGCFPSVYVAMEHGTLCWRVVSESYSGNVVITETVMPDLTLILRRSDQVTGIEADRMVGDAENTCE